MPIKVVAGPINSGKTKKAIEMLGSSPLFACTIVTPSESAAAALVRRYQKDSPVVLGSQITTLKKFLAKLADVTLPVITRMQSALLIHRLMTETTLKYFKSGKPSFGVASQIAGTIAELKKNCVDTTRLSNILATRGGVKENDLLTIYKAYEDSLAKAELLDESDILLQAIKNLRNGDPSAQPQDDSLKTLIFDEFIYFSPGELELLKALRDCHPNLDIHITAPLADNEDSMAAEFLRKRCEKLCVIPAQAGIPVNTGSPPKARGDDKPTLDILFARSPVQEARFVLQKINELSKDNEPDDIVIVSPNSPDLRAHFSREAGGGSRASLTPLIAEMFAMQNGADWPLSATPNEYAKLIKEHLTVCHPERSEGSRGDRDPSASPQDDSIRSLQKISETENALAEIVASSQALGLHTIEGATFMRILKDKLSQTNPIAELSHDLPFVALSSSEPLAFSPKHLIFAHATQDAFPSAATERMFFNDIDTLSPDPDNIIDEIFLSSEDSMALQSYIFDTYLQKSSESASFVYPIIDDGGKETERSPFLAGLGTPSPLPELSLEIKDPEEVKKKIAVELDREMNDDRYPEFNGTIKDEKAAALLHSRFGAHAFSPTSLEKYAECPFEFFALKVLGAEAKREDLPEIDPRDRGTIVHWALETFFKEHSKEFEDAIHDPKKEKELWKLTEGLLDEAMRKYSELIKNASPALMPYQKKMFLTMIVQAIALELEEARSLTSPLTPFKFETAFGKENEPVVEVRAGDGKKVLFSGRIDRIDSDKTKGRMLIVDYKTGKVDSVVNKIKKGLHLQLPIYVFAAKKLFPDMLILGGLLFGVYEAKKCHGFVLKEFNDTHYDVGGAHSKMDAEKWNETLDAGIAAACSYVDSINKGHFKPCPNEGKCSRYCNYEDVCRYTKEKAD